jgi:hypothetical protein
LAPVFIFKPMQNPMNDALNGLAMMAAFIAVVGMGAGFFASHQAHKYRALAEAEREARRQAGS